MCFICRLYSDICHGKPSYKVAKKLFADFESILHVFKIECNLSACIPPRTLRLIRLRHVSIPGSTSQKFEWGTYLWASTFFSLSLLSSICCSSSSPNLPPLLKQVQKLSLVKSLLKCKELRAGSINPGRLEGIRRWRSSKSSAVGQFMTLTCITYSSSHQHWLLLNDKFLIFLFILFISFIRCIYYTYAKVD